MEFFEKLSKYIEESKVLGKPVLLFLTLLGAIYLNGFLSEFDIPFPLDISLLPTILISIGSLSLILLFFLICYITLVGLINHHPISSKILSLIHTNEDGWYLQTWRNSIVYGLYSYVIPFAFLIVWIGYYQTESSPLTMAILFGLYALWAFIYGVIVARSSKDSFKGKVKSAFLMTAHVFAVQFVSLLSLSVFLLIVLARAKDISELELLLVVCCYAAVNFVCIMPMFSKAKFDELNQADKKLTPDQIIQQSQQYPTYFIIVVLLVFTITPNISPYVGELPLRLLNIGGGQEVTIKDTRRYCDAWPEFIIGKKDEDSCVTKNGKLLIQLGDRAYLTFHKEKIGHLVISLDVGKASIVKKVPEDSFYFSKASVSNEDSPDKESKDSGAVEQL